MKGLIKISIIIFTFSFLNAVILYIKGSLRFEQATQEEIRSRYVNAPDFISGLGIALVLISILYFVYKIIIYLDNEYNIWLMCFLILLINYVICLAIASMAGNVLSWKALLNFILIWGINFFIPFSDQLINKKTYTE